MRFMVLATDYDGTIAHEGRVNKFTLKALEEVRATGRYLLLVTGRQLTELLSIFPEYPLFEWIIAENGALLFQPSSRKEIILGSPPPLTFIKELNRFGIEPAIGQVVVATHEPNETKVLETIHELGLELQVIFNKGAVMVLPSGINKKTGLLAALSQLNLSAHEVVGIGDAENDHAFLSICECSVATANAIATLKDNVDIVMECENGAGVVQLIDSLIQYDLKDLEPHLKRHHLLIGTQEDGKKIKLPSYNHNILIAGPSASGKSTSAASFIENLTQNNYQFCIIDPEGDYAGIDGAVTLGTSRNEPVIEEIMELLLKPEQNIVISLIGLRLADRPPFFLELLTLILNMRAKTGRPHWLIVDEAHHLLPASWQYSLQVIPNQLQCMLFITVHPDQLAPSILSTMGTMITVGANPEQTIEQFCQARNLSLPQLPTSTLNPGEAIIWPFLEGKPPCKIEIIPSNVEKLRHSRKYTEGELPPERSFYFRGPKGKLNLRAQNLILFLQLADGVDDETWNFHLKMNDYSSWFKDCIKDSHLAAEAKKIENDHSLSTKETRTLLRQLIEKYYTLPTTTPLPIANTDAEPKLS